MARGIEIAAFDACFSARAGREEWASILELRNRSGLLDGLVLYDEIMAPFFANNFYLNKVVPEAWRFQMLVFTLDLHDTRDPDDPSSGLTLGNLQQLCARQEIASPGRVFAYLQIMQLGGFLTRTRSPLDRRIVTLEPSPKLLATVETWNMAIFRIIDAVAPECGLAGHAAVHPQLGGAMRRRSAQRLLDGWKPLEGLPDIMHFLASDGGWMLLARCMADLLRQGDGTQIVPVAVNLTDFAVQFGVSRSHLRRLLESAHSAGLLDAPPRNGAHIVLSLKLVCATLAWFAGYLSNYRDCTHAALADLGIATLPDAPKAKTGS